jgi:hypothetical protein
MHLIPLLLEAGADPQLRDNLGLNAIDWAQRRGATEAIAVLKNPRPQSRTRIEIPAPPAAPPAEAKTIEREVEQPKPVSTEEKSQRWLAGLKQRIAEQSQREVPEPSVESVSLPEPAVEPPLTQITPPVAEEAPRPRSRRKRCPKCGAIYNSELVAYCAHHIVPLVDADEAPIISEPPRTSSPVLFWMIIVITLTGSLVVGSLIAAYFYGGNKPSTQTATSPPPAGAVQKGTPAVGQELEGKAVTLPVAECPLNGQEAIPGTVVVRITIDRTGKVTSTHASGGDWLLRGAANEAAMKSTFSPEKLRGRETEGTITYTFEP